MFTCVQSLSTDGDDKQMCVGGKLIAMLHALIEQQIGRNTSTKIIRKNCATTARFLAPHVQSSLRFSSLSKLISILYFSSERKTRKLYLVHEKPAIFSLVKFLLCLETSKIDINRCGATNVNKKDFSTAISAKYFSLPQKNE